MDSIPLPTQLLPCLAIPFVELFPDLCLGWWTPPSLNLHQYNKMWYLRVSLQSIALFPVLAMLLPMTEDSSNFSLLVLGTFACIFLRNLFMGKQIKLVMNQPLWKTDLPPDKRRALFVVLCNARKSDVTKFDEMGAKYSEFPTKIFAAVVYGIVNILKSHRGGQDENNLLTAFAVFAIGGVGIGGTRHGSLILDIIFRCVFGAGFIAILHFLAETPDIILIKSLD